MKMFPNAIFFIFKLLFHWGGKKKRKYKTKRKLWFLRRTPRQKLGYLVVPAGASITVVCPTFISTHSISEFTLVAWQDQDSMGNLLVRASWQSQSCNLPSDLQIQIWRIQGQLKTLNPTACGQLALPRCGGTPTNHAHCCVFFNNYRHVWWKGGG